MLFGNKKQFFKAHGFLTFLISLLCQSGWASEPVYPLQSPLGLDYGKVQLGKQLFQDVRLSNKENIACSTCHSLEKAGADGLAFSPGTNGELTGRNTPTVFNSNLNIAQFWDGRANTLKEQIDAVVNNPLEMGGDWPSIIQRLSADQEFVEKMQIAYEAPISKENLIDALDQYMSALVTVDSDFDRYLHGDQTAISDKAKDGYKLFKSIGCASCHQGSNVGGNLFQKAGIKVPLTDRNSGYNVFGTDYGRYEITGRERDKFVFRVPSLRNVVETAPYFHNAQATNLDTAILIMARLQLGRDLKMNQVQLIKEFLYTLNSDIPEELK